MRNARSVCGWTQISYRLRSVLLVHQGQQLCQNWGIDPLTTLLVHQVSIVTNDRVGRLAEGGTNPARAEFIHVWNKKCYIYLVGVLTF